MSHLSERIKFDGIFRRDGNHTINSGFTAACFFFHLKRKVEFKWDFLFKLLFFCRKEIQFCCGGDKSFINKKSITTKMNYLSKCKNRRPQRTVSTKFTYMWRWHVTDLIWLKWDCWPINIKTIKPFVLMLMFSTEKKTHFVKRETKVIESFVSHHHILLMCYGRRKKKRTVIEHKFRTSETVEVKQKMVKFFRKIRSFAPFERSHTQLITIIHHSITNRWWIYPDRIDLQTM